MNVAAAQVFQDPGCHGGVAAILMIVKHRGYAVAQPCFAKGGGKLLRLAETSVRALQLLERNADRPSQVAHQIAHGRPGVDYQVPRPTDMIRDPIRGNEFGHQPTISKSVSTEVGLATDWVTGEPSTAKRQTSRRVSSSASARTKHLAEILP